jgi:hypothetical protein
MLNNYKQDDKTGKIAFRQWQQEADLVKLDFPVRGHVLEQKIPMTIESSWKVLKVLGCRPVLSE